MGLESTYRKYVSCVLPIGVTQPVKTAGRAFSLYHIYQQPFQFSTTQYSTLQHTTHYTTHRRRGAGSRRGTQRRVVCYLSTARSSRGSAPRTPPRKHTRGTVPHTSDVRTSRTRNPHLPSRPSASEAVRLASNATRSYTIIEECIPETIPVQYWYSTRIHA